MTPHQGNIILFRSSQQFPRVHLGPLKVFLAYTAPFKGPQLASRALLPELQRYKDTIRHAALGAEVQDTVNNN